MMAQIYDLSEDAIRRLKKLVPDADLRAAADEALATPKRTCRESALSVHRMTLTDDQRQGVVARLRLMLAREGFEGEGGTMLPIGHIYEGFIQMFSKPSRVMV